MINILYCGNKKAFDGILISTLSLIKHTKEPLKIHLATMDLTEIKASHTPLTREHADYLANAMKAVNSDSEVELFDITDLFLQHMSDNPNMDSFYTPYCLLRLFSDLIEGFPQKMLYLDTDTVINADISELYATNLNGFEFAAVEDYLGKTFKHRGYINSGVLLMNLTAIRKTKLFERTRIACKTKKMWFPDQDALNSYVRKKKMLDAKFNEQHKLKKDTVIRHFSKTIKWLPFYHTQNIKPWEVEKIHKTMKLFVFDDILLDYKQRKSKRPDLFL